jgi:hypothetical protein
VTQLYPRALGSFFVASYDSQGYGLSSEGLGPQSDCSGKAQKNCASKFQTHSLVRAGAPQQENVIVKQKKKENLVPDSKTDGPTNSRS